MKDYTIAFHYFEGEMEFMLHTDHIFKAKNHKQAMEQAQTIEDKFTDFLIPYYDKKERDMLVDIKENPYFKTASLYEFRNSSFDENLFSIPGKIISKEEFLEIFEKNYEDHMKTRERETFECVAYGVKELS